MISDEMKKRLNELSTTHICDALSDTRIIDSSIKPLISSKKFIGHAFTVQCDGDLLPVIKAIETADQDAIIVIDSHSSPYAVLGEIFSTVAKSRKIQGIIIDGFCRDIAEIKSLDFPIYARGVSPKAGTKNKVGAVQSKIICGGVAVMPNDIIFSDENGILVLDPEKITDILTAAEKIKNNEEKAISAVKSGRTLNDILNFSTHYNNLTAGKNGSELAWTLDFQA